MKRLSHTICNTGDINQVVRSFGSVRTGWRLSNTVERFWLGDHNPGLEYGRGLIDEKVQTQWRR